MNADEMKASARVAIEKGIQEGRPGKPYGRWNRINACVVNEFNSKYGGSWACFTGVLHAGLIVNTLAVRDGTKKVKRIIVWRM